MNPQLIIDKLLAERGNPWLPVQRQALEAMKAGDAETLRLLSAINLDDSFCRARGYMASIPKLPPTVAILIAESARVIAGMLTGSPPRAWGQHSRNPSPAAAVIGSPPRAWGQLKGLALKWS